MHLLTELAHEFGNDRGDVYKEGKPGNGYTEIYGPLFEEGIEETKKVLELGAHKGQGLLMWQEYFPNAEIYGMEILESNNLWKAPEGPSYTEKDTRVHVMVGNCGKKEDLDRLIEKYGGDFDIIIDDCGHLSDQQQFSMAYLFPFLKPGGIYIIEDLNAPYVNDGFIGSRDTCRMIGEFTSIGKINSGYMTDKESKYIESNIDDHMVYLSGPNDIGKIWVVKKKF